MEDPKQDEVVKNRSKGNLLVSASAGAGKTKVLVDRVVRELINNDQIGIGNLLIVTFTRAAAKQMKDRIRQKLQNSINSKLYPRRDRILQQIEDLPNANIGTLDSFCQKVVERYYYVIGLDPNFRILNDNTEVILLRDLVWKNVREDLYDEDSDAFKELAANFFNRRINSDDQLTDPLTNLIYELYDSMMIAPDQKKWSDDIKQVYTVKPSLKQSYLYKHVLHHQLKVQLQQIISNYKDADHIAKHMQLDKEYPVINSEYKAMQDLYQCLDPESNSWNELRSQALNVAHDLKQRFPSTPRKASDDAKKAHAEVKDDRDQAKKAFNNMIDNFFILDEKGNTKVISRTSVIIDELLKVVKRFRDAYTRTKRQRHVLEFIDIERAALNILNRSKAVRAQLQRTFHEIMIDEYQDDNQLQDTILSKVARPNPKTGEPSNVFMVGDVKQSIYRFRSADPELFIKKDRTYRKPNPNGNQEITLNKNYRSTQNIDRFVNLIFKQVMDERFGRVDYSKEPEKFGAIGYRESDNNHLPVNVMVYDEAKNRYQNTNDDKNGIKDSTYGQIEMVAQEIRRLVDSPKETIYDKKSPNYKRPIDYRDIALIASTRDDNVTISDVFRRYKIPVQMLGSQNYFKTTEIQVMLSLLEIIDNPDQDIPLVAVLRSPMIGLDEDQLAYLRINSKTGNYFQAVKKFNDQYPSVGYPESKIGDEIHDTIKKFLNDLKRYRKITQRHGLVDLIWNIYQTTGFLDYVGGMPAGTQRQANLHALYERAAQYEQANFHGLFQFVRFIHQLQNQQKDLTEAAPQQSKNMVTSVTIHGSKGLEFPVVFLIDASRGFNQMDLHNDYILSNRYGLGIKYFDAKLRSELNTLPYQGIVNDERENNLAEEMRKLYVAMTRAEQRLYVVGQATQTTRAHKDPRDALISQWEKVATSNDLILNLTDRVKAKNYLDWIGASLVRAPLFKKNYSDQDQGNCPDLKNDKTKFKLTFTNDAQIIKNRSKFAPDSSIKLLPRKLTDDEKKYIRHVMTFNYPHQAATHEGNYRSVSDVKQLFEDPNNIQMGQLDPTNHEDYHGLSNQYVTGDFTTPKFIQQAHQPKATEVGTATHLVLQMLDLHHRPTMKSVDDMIKRLVADQMIDLDVAKKIDQYNILSFFRSSYGQAVLKHPDDYHRETPFSLLVNAHQILPKEFKADASERILIHGIIDGYLYDGNQASIVDYKTDYVDFKNKSASVKKIKARYQGQLNLYGMALSSVIGKAVKHKYLYLLSSHQLVKI